MQNKVFSGNFHKIYRNIKNYENHRYQSTNHQNVQDTHTNPVIIKQHGSLEIQSWDQVSWRSIHSLLTGHTRRGSKVKGMICMYKSLI